jgi:Cu(I)/Ag(I) efflux system membrane protein CusA/SilA
MKTLLLLSLTAVLFLSGCSPSRNTGEPSSGERSQADRDLYPAVPADGTYYGRGKVTKINLENGSVEIDHDDIPYLMPKMMMEFNVKEKNMLNAVKVGDTVNFILEYKHPSETIVEISKSP